MIQMPFKNDIIYIVIHPPHMRRYSNLTGVAKPTHYFNNFHFALFLSHKLSGSRKRRTEKDTHIFGLFFFLLHLIYIFLVVPWLNASVFLPMFFLFVVFRENIKFNRNFLNGSCWEKSLLFPMAFFVTSHF